MLFCHNFIFFMRLRLGSQLVVFIYVVLSDNQIDWDYKFDTADKKMKKSHTGNMPQSYSRF